MRRGRSANARAPRLPAFVAGASAIAMAALLAIITSGEFSVPPATLVAPEPKPSTPTDRQTADTLAALSDAELSAIDPLVMNLIVARGIPGNEHLEIDWYARTVDAWAKRINEANLASESISHDDLTYRVSREFWMAGGMAVMLAGPAFGIRYTTRQLDAAHPEQQFVYGVIDNRMGTCASMPVLYMAIGHRLGWPIKAVVSGDHMWARWDDGQPGGQRFNLEATSAHSDGGYGTFASLSDAQYAEQLKTPPEAIANCSDLTSLTPRQTLGVFLQSRAGYWAASGCEAKARKDIALALSCFPQNRDIQHIFRVTYGQRVRGGLSHADFDALYLRAERKSRAIQPADPSDSGPP